MGQYSPRSSVHNKTMIIISSLCGLAIEYNYDSTSLPKTLILRPRKRPRAEQKTSRRLHILPCRTAIHSKIQPRSLKYKKVTCIQLHRYVIHIRNCVYRDIGVCKSRHLVMRAFMRYSVVYPWAQSIKSHKYISNDYGGFTSVYVKGI